MSANDDSPTFTGQLTYRGQPITCEPGILSANAIGWREVKREGEHVAYFEHVDQNGRVWRRARVKWDGCIDYERAFNTPFPDCPEPDILHICDAVDEIAFLQTLQRGGGERNAELRGRSWVTR